MHQAIVDKPKVAVLENGLISTYTAREGLMRALIEEGYEVYILTQSNNHINKALELGLKVIEVGSANYNPLKIGSYIYKLKKVLNQIKPDICLTFSIRPAIFGNIVARTMNIPVITNITGTGPLFDNPNIAYRIISKMYPYALKSSNTVFFQNPSDQKSFIDHGFVTGQQAELIPGSGVDYRKFSPKDKSPEVRGKFTFLYIGRLLKDKGVPEFIEAARILKNKYPEIRFQIIGPEWHQNTKSNQIKASLVRRWMREGIVDYMGEKTDVRKYISDADCVVLPSHREGTSNVLLEGSSMERPCIATNVIGCKEIIEDGVTGFLCRLKDPKDLAGKMEKMYLLDDLKRKQMGKAARRKMMREFDKQIVIDSYLQAVKQALGIEEDDSIDAPKLILQDEAEPHQMAVR